MEGIQEFESNLKQNQVEIPPLKVRCPGCLKLYVVRHQNVREAKPKFECIQCHKRFWLAYEQAVGQEEVVGYPEDWLKSQVPESTTNDAEDQGRQTEFTALERLFQCPKCGEKYSGGQSECRACGVIFEQIHDSQEVEDRELGVARAVKAAWDRVIENYEDPEVHGEFVLICQKNADLTFASKKYSKLLETVGDDTIARAMLEKLAVIAAAPAATRSQESRGLVSRSKAYRPRLSTLVLFLAGIMIGVGYLVPMLRNMVGVGVSIVFFTLAIRYYFND